MRTQILDLRLRTGQQRDPTTDPDWFVNMALARSSNPWIVLLTKHQWPVAALLLAEKRIFGMPSGYLKAEGMDEGFLICAPEMRSTYLPLLLEGLLSNRSVLIAQVAQLSDAKTAYCSPADPDRFLVEWKQGLYHYRLKLSQTFDKTLARHGAHTRRNIRYYLRKAQAEGFRFLSGLTADQRLEAVLSLCGDATHKVSVESALLRESAMANVPDSFAMGVQAEDGTWLSYLTGWRHDERTFVNWQMNRTTSRCSSIGTAIRSFLMQEEIARGATEVVFLGGSSAVFKRCCEIDPSVHLIVRRRGVRGWALSRLLERFVAPGHPLRVAQPT